MAITNSSPDRPLTPLKQLLGQSGGGALRDHARRLLRLEKAVHQLLPQPLPAYCRVANLRNQELILLVDSPAWAGRLRFLTPNLQERLNKQYALNIRSITLRVRPRSEAQAEKQTAPHRRLLSAQNADMLTSLGHCHDDALGQALLRLARHSKKPL